MCNVHAFKTYKAKPVRQLGLGGAASGGSGAPVQCGVGGLGSFDGRLWLFGRHRSMLVRGKNDFFKAPAP